jgi:5'-deoxynucleotidase YfbR-like HD superfamily hydrolase
MQSERLWHSGRVKRWHAFPIIGEQTVADHAWGVALIVAEIAEDELSISLLKAALTHDSPELLTGDMPYQTKKRWPELAQTLLTAEMEVEREYGIDFHLNVKQREILKWADMFELLMFADAQRNLGNRNVVEMQRLAYSLVTEAPTVSAYKLLERFTKYECE